jgi:hypothetical protein
MKKLLLSAGLFIGLVFTGNAQVLHSENFNNLTLGNIGTNFAGTAVGQGNFITLADNGAIPTTTTNAGNANFQVVAAGNQGSYGLTIQSPNGDKGQRLMVKNNGIVTEWASRTSGNNIIQTEVDFFTGPPSTSTTQNGVRIYGVDTSNNLRTFAGFFYTPNNKTITGAAYGSSGGTPGAYTWTVGDAVTRVLADNTWYNIGIAYDTTTGEFALKVKNPDGSTRIDFSLSPANRVLPAPFVVNQVRFLSVAPNTNTVSASLTYDNFKITATPTVSLLGTAGFLASKFSVYPNPSNNVVNISNDVNGILNGVTITDINGRTVKSVQFNNVATAQVNISDLSAGMYMMNIASDQGNVTKKIIKN